MQDLLDVLYNMKDPKTNRYYCRVYDGIEDSLLVNILVYLEKRALWAWAITSKRFYNLVKNYSKSS